MPRYRALHVKVIDSFDFNDMPDDFVRLTWVLLPLILDSEGRGIDSPMWIRAKMYPLRNGVIDSEIRRAFDWFAEHKMIIRYQVNGRGYFYIPTWKEYQKGTQKEAPSNLPSPPEVRRKSGGGPEEVSPAVYAYESASESVVVSGEVDEFGFPIPEGSAELSTLSIAFEKLANLTAYRLDDWEKSCQNMVRNNVTPEILSKAYAALREKNYTVSGPWSIEKTAISMAAEDNKPRDIASFDENGRIL